MSTSVPFQYTLTASTNLIQVRGGGTMAANLKGWIIDNTTAATCYIKLGWYPNTTTVTVGTTVPQITIPVTNGTTPIANSFPDGITGVGQLWMWVTGAAAASDTTATAAGGLITLLLE